MVCRSPRNCYACMLPLHYNTRLAICLYVNGNSENKKLLKLRLSPKTDASMEFEKSLCRTAGRTPFWLQGLCPVRDISVINPIVKLILIDSLPCLFMFLFFFQVSFAVCVTVPSLGITHRPSCLGSTSCTAAYFRHFIAPFLFCLLDIILFSFFCYCGVSMLDHPVRDLISLLVLFRILADHIDVLIGSGLIDTEKIA